MLNTRPSPGRAVARLGRTLALVLALALVATACTSGDTTTTSVTFGSIGGTNRTDGGTGGGVVPGLFAAALQEFDSCDAFLSHIKAEALERVGPYGLPGQGYWGGPILFGVEEDAVAATTAAGDAGFARSAQVPQAGVDYSTTNVQEAGVDEPDIVKTDGNRILAIAQGRLHYIDLSSGAPVLTSSVDLPWGWNQELLMVGDTAIVMATASRYDLQPRLATGMFAPDIAAYSDISVFVQLDISDANDISVIDSLYVDGRYLSARMIGDTARIAFSSAPVGLDFVQPAGGGLRGEQRAIEVNKDVIRESTLENWMPYYILEGPDGAVLDEGTLLDCESAFAPKVFSGFSMLSVLTVDLSEGIDPGAVTGVMSGGDTVYASQDHLYVATQQWLDWQTFDERDAVREAEAMKTYIHKFDITDPTRTSYLASGEVDGFLLNQFAMSEHEGNLRVASTNVPTWWWWGDTRDSESRVDVLAQNGNELELIGTVGGLGEGEQIFAVRFQGDTAYVVTFRQTDPLYTVDLTDPTNPQVLGELKILGYSSYLHPLGDGLVMGVGQDADENGRVTGSQVSIFDVSDLANPQRLQQFTFASGYSEAEYDHRAFLHWAPSGLTVLPVQWWEYDDDYELESAFVGAVALDASAEAIVEVGTVQHLDDDLKGDEFYEWSWAAQIRRSLVVGDTLFTLSERGLMGSALDTLEQQVFIEFGG